MSLVTSRYWKDAEFNGCGVSSKYKPCKDKETPYDDYKAVHKVSVLVCKTFSTGIRRKINKIIETRNSIKQLFQH